MRTSYKTILNTSLAEYEEKKSRFLASVKSVSSEDEAQSFIEGLKTKYWDATHNVYAYFIGGDTVLQRFSDDGEPSGTAGLPVLEVIKRMELQDIAVVVTRYFGGTLLGAAGLVRAYGKSAALGIESAEVVTKKLCTLVNVILEYTIFGKVQSFIISSGYHIKGIVYGQDVEMLVYVPSGSLDEFNASIKDVTNDRALIDVQDNAYITLDNEDKLISD